MRINIQLPDSTSPKTVAAIQALAERLSAHPESVHGIMGVAERQAAYSVAEDIVFNADGTVTLTVAQLAAVEEAEASIARGEGIPWAEVDKHLDEVRSQWLAERARE